MRNGQNKRMRGRNRNNSSSNNNNNSNTHNRGHHHNPLTRVYESNGQDVKIRGTAHTVAEKYLQLARDAQTSGDHVTAENHHQHAEHYLRLIAAAQEQFRQQNPYYQPQQAAPGSDNGDGSYDDDDGQPMQGQPMQGQPMQGQPMQGQPMQGQPTQGQPMQGQPQNQPVQNHPSNYGNQQPPYPPREQPQPYGQPPQQVQPQFNQPPQPRPQQQPQPQPQPVAFDSNDGLPSFITGGQPPQPNGQNGHDNQGGDRFPLHRRRRRHRGPREGGPQDDTRPVNE